MGGENTPCWFCGKTLGKRAWNRHHLVPSRYLGKTARKDVRNLVGVHISCHQRFHRTYDRDQVPMVEYLFRMNTINYGHLIFEGG